MSSLQCQRCRLPLLPHDSLNELTNAQVNLITSRGESSSSNNKDPVTVQAPNTVNPGESFVMLTDSLLNTGEKLLNKDKEREHSLSHRIETLESLFDTLSAKSDIDYPVCNECAELVREGLKRKYDESCNERDVYIAFLNKLKDQPGAGSEEVEELVKEIKTLETENQKALDELIQSEQEYQKVEKEYDELKKESEQLEKEEESFYERQNEFALQLQQYVDEKERIDSLYENNSTLLQKLQKVNVYNDVFCIGHDGHFGTVNGLRLGRLRDKKVEWSEINAAWGQALLLLATVAMKLDFKFNGYRLRPLGSVSKIDKIETDARGNLVKTISLELYSSGDYTFERFINYKRLDSAMVAFLNCLKQIGEHVESLDSSLKLPYVIDGDKIGGSSIRLSINASNESWTNACKYVLTNAKWILAFASTR